MTNEYSINGAYDWGNLDSVFSSFGGGDHMGGPFGDPGGGGFDLGGGAAAGAPQQTAPAYIAGGQMAAGALQTVAGLGQHAIAGKGYWLGANLHYYRTH
jgi:hypothetical protein